jgi:hypothetical protein
MKCFSNNKELGYAELIIQMKLAFKTILNKSIGENKAKEIITHCRNQNWIIQETTQGKNKIGEFTGLV